MSNSNTEEIIARLSPEDLMGLMAALLAESSDEEYEDQLPGISSPDQGGGIASHAQAVAMMDMARQYVHNEPLVTAACSGDLSQLQYLLRTGNNINAKDGLQETALYAASCHDNIPAVAYLLQSGANPDLQCSQDWSALHAVSRSGNESIARLLLDWGALPNIQDGIGWSPLHVASLYGHRNIVVALLENGADPNLAAEDLRTPLHTAVDFGHENVVRALVLNGASLDVQDDKGETPLHISVMERPFPSPASVLLELGANANIRSDNGAIPLHIAIGSDLDIELGMVPLLLCGSDVDSPDENGCTPLLHAISRFQDEEAEPYLRNVVTASTNVNLVTSTPQGQISPLVRAIERRNIIAIKILLEHGADVNVVIERHKIRLSSIYHAALCSDPEEPEIMKLLLDAGSDCNEKAKGKITLAHICSLKGHAACLRLLLERGAEPNTRDALKCTPLHVAVRGGNIDCVSVLLEHGADVNAIDKSGATALHHAVESNDQRLVEALLLNGPDIQIRDRALRTLLALAQTNLREQLNTVRDVEADTAEERDMEEQIATATWMKLIWILMETLAEQDSLTQTFINPEERKGWFRRMLCERSNMSEPPMRHGQALKELKGRYVFKQMEVV